MRIDEISPNHHTETAGGKAREEEPSRRRRRLESRIELHHREQALQGENPGEKLHKSLAELREVVRLERSAGERGPLVPAKGKALNREEGTTPLSSSHGAKYSATISSVGSARANLERLAARFRGTGQAGQ